MSESADQILTLPISLPGEWGRAPLRDLAEFVADGDWVESKDQGGSDFRLLQISNIGTGSFVETGNFRYITEDTFERLRCTEILAGDVLVARMPEPTGRAWFVSKLEGRCITAVDVAIVRPLPERVDGRYLSYFLNTPVNLSRVDGLATGTTRRRVRRADLARLEVPVPPIAEQRAIAGVLGALDDKIESNRRLAQGCEQLLSAIAALASAQTLVPLSELAEPSRSPVDPQALGEEQVDLFSIPAFDAQRLPELCSASTIMSGKFSVGWRSVLVSRLNPSTPRVWLADPTLRRAMCSTEFLVLRPRDGQPMATVWLAAVSQRFTEEAERRATGTSFSHQRIKPDDALSIEVSDTRLLDDSLLAEADAWLERALQARRESAAAASLRDALLPELLSGRLRVRKAEEMAGSV